MEFLLILIILVLIVIYFLDKRKTNKEIKQKKYNIGKTIVEIILFDKSVFEKEFTGYVYDGYTVNSFFLADEWITKSGKIGFFHIGKRYISDSNIKDINTETFDFFVDFNNEPIKKNDLEIKEIRLPDPPRSAVDVLTDPPTFEKVKIADSDASVFDVLKNPPKLS